MSAFAGCVRRHRATAFAMTPTPHPRPIVVSGPSGGGKSTILQRAMKEYPTAFAFSVSRMFRVFVFFIYFPFKIRHDNRELERNTASIITM
jgi:hypothetical protein